MSEMHRESVMGDMTIFAAHALKEQLLSALATDDLIEVDLSQVSEIDSAGLQLLLAAKLQAAVLGKSLHFVGDSPAVAGILELCNLPGLLSDPVPISQA